MVAQRLTIPACCLFLCLCAAAAPLRAEDRAQPRPDLWALEPLATPAVPIGVTSSANPIDAFIAAEYQARGIEAAGPTDKGALLRRVSLDLTGLPPTPAELEAFLNDTSPSAYEKVVDRLLASEQHGVRYGRHWLDVLRYADVEERMTAAQGIHLWRDWLIDALNADLPYDQFVRTQLTGYRQPTRTEISTTGIRARAEPRTDDMFALGFLARGAVGRDIGPDKELAINAVETVSTAFMGLTVGCAKCHDHFYDPISQRDFYAMKALFDPLVVRKVTLATPAEIVAHGKALDAVEKERKELEQEIDALGGTYKRQLYEERVAMLPADVQAIIRKPAKERTAAEQKIADDYYPILRVDASKVLLVISEDIKEKYRELTARLAALNGGGTRRRDPIPPLPAFWTIQLDRQREAEPSYILTSGDPDRPENDHPVQPGWPFAPAQIEFREGRVEAFSDWLTAPENPLFPRVAANRIWQWHFGKGLQQTPSDFGNLAQEPTHRALLDWLAAKFVAGGFRMKELHRLIVTSETYKLSSEASPELAEANRAADSENTYLWHFPLLRLDAETLWDSIMAAADDLDLSLGGVSFDLARNEPNPKPGQTNPADRRPTVTDDSGPRRRGAYMVRGYATSREVVPNFLQSFDVDDGRAPCPTRTRTVTAPQALFLMNSGEIERASRRFAERVLKASGGELGVAVDLAYRVAVSRPPSPSESERALAFLDQDPARLPQLTWLLLNLDEFLYAR